MKKLLFFIPILAVLSACQPPMTREQELAIYRSRCFDYGFQMGSVDFARCMQEQEAREADLSMKARKIQAIEQQNWTEQEKVRIKQNEYEMKRNKQRGR
ncbi:MAG: membrane lipoprotein lipid attachment site-containing protein [Alphaproteobacteria bacterium]|nr:membrane lipoprotein lipid attachment site-containing protein [Alphaproteobacteria bacterium]